jgi:hypothetical protein
VRYGRTKKGRSALTKPDPTPLWNRQARDRFWTLVRGRMAELGLEQVELARVLVVDRSSATRRLRPGGVMTRPSAMEVDNLVRFLRLEGERAAELRRLTGDGAAVALAPTDRGLFRRAGLVAGLALGLVIVLLVVVALRGPAPAGPSVRITEPAAGSAIAPGGATVRGIARGVADGSGRRLWLLTYAERAYRPVRQTVPDAPTLEWTATLDAADLLQQPELELLVVLAGPDADRGFAEWLAARARGEAPAPFSSLPAQASVLDTLRVRRSSD